jgi:hypothetical protein
MKSTSSHAMTRDSGAAPDPAALTRREAIKRTTLLLGAALSPSLLAGLARAQAAAASGGGAARPRHLAPGPFATTAAVAERILPRTDTPGAQDVGVPAFIDLMYGEYLTPAERTVLAAGLTDVEKASAAAHRRGFTQLGAAEQDAILARIAKESETKEKTFFHLIREVTLLGYFSSEPIGKNVLNYDPIPGVFRGCVPIAETGNRAWTR